MEIKAEDKKNKFNIQQPILNKSVIDCLNNWCNIIEKQQYKEDVWIEIPQLPNYNLKNLQIISNFETTDEIIENNITFEFDVYKIKIKNARKKAVKNSKSN